MRMKRHSHSSLYIPKRVLLPLLPSNTNTNNTTGNRMDIPMAAIIPNTTTSKKRDRATMTTKKRTSPQSHSVSSSLSSSTAISIDQDEYDRAVSFLREFHSRRVASYSFIHHPLRSSSLDSILENEDADDEPRQQQHQVVEDLLSSDFALALNVGSNSSGSSTCSQSSSSSTAALSPSPFLPRMKKTITSKCLLSLDDSTSRCPSLASSTSDSELSSESSSSNSSSSTPSFTFSSRRVSTGNISSPSHGEEEDSDYYFGFGAMEEHSNNYFVMSPTTKHRRVSLRSG